MQIPGTISTHLNLAHSLLQFGSDAELQSLVSLHLESVKRALCALLSPREYHQLNVTQSESAFSVNQQISDLQNQISKALSLCEKLQHPQASRSTLLELTELLLQMCRQVTPAFSAA